MQVHTYTHTYQIYRDIIYYFILCVMSKYRRIIHNINITLNVLHISKYILYVIGFFSIFNSLINLIIIKINIYNQYYIQHIKINKIFLSFKITIFRLNSIKLIVLNLKIIFLGIINYIYVLKNAKKKFFFKTYIIFIRIKFPILIL